MAGLCYSQSSVSLKKLIIASKPTSRLLYPTNSKFSVHFQIMNSTSKSSSSTPVFLVPELDSDEKDRIADQTFERYSAKTMQRNGKGTAIVWFRNDLRILDNEVLYKAWISSHMVLPVYCVDPRLFQTTHYFGFPKTGGIIHSYMYTNHSSLILPKLN